MLSSKYLENVYMIFCQEMLHFYDSDEFSEEELKFFQGVINDVRKNYDALRKNLQAVEAVIECKK